MLHRPIHGRIRIFTTIRLEDDLKVRINAAARRAGTTTHAFILGVLTRTVEQVALDHAFHAVAEERWARIRATGRTVAWGNARTWLNARAQGQKARKPAGRTGVA